MLHECSPLIVPPLLPYLKCRSNSLFAELSSWLAVSLSFVVHWIQLMRYLSGRPMKMTRVFLTWLLSWFLPFQEHQRCWYVMTWWVVIWMIGELIEHCELSFNERIILTEDWCLICSFIQGFPSHETYRFYHWNQTDIFVYFSHRFVTIPPPGWVTAGHRHGVPVLGRF